MVPTAASGCYVTGLPLSHLRGTPKRVGMSDFSRGVLVLFLFCGPTVLQLLTGWHFSNRRIFLLFTPIVAIRLVYAFFASRQAKKNVQSAKDKLATANRAWLSAINDWALANDVRIPDSDLAFSDAELRTNLSEQIHQIRARVLREVHQKNRERKVL